MVGTPTFSDRLQTLTKVQKQLLAQRLGVRPRKEDGTKLVAFVSGDVDENDLKQQLQQRLPQYMVPSAIHVLEKLPRTPNGKVDRLHLETKAHQQGSVTGKAAAPALLDLSDDIEAKLFSIWTDLLTRQEIRRDDNFFEVGGHSLLAVRLLARIKTAFDKDLPVSIIMEAPTIASLAAYLRDQEEAPSLIITMQSDGDAAPLFCFPVHELGITPYRFLTEKLGAIRPIYGFDVPTKQDAYRPIEDLATEYTEEMLRMQPQGPYYLCGMSSAGMLAYEVARKLAAQGITDVEIVLFDTIGPVETRVMKGLRGYLFWLRGVLRQFFVGRVNRMAYLKDVRWMLSRETKKIIKRVLKFVLRRNAMASTLTDPEEESIYDMEHNKAEYFAKQRPHNGSIILYRSTIPNLKGRVPREHENYLGWDTINSGPIELEFVRGNHFIINDRFIEDTGLRLRNRLVDFDNHRQASLIS